MDTFKEKITKWYKYGLWTVNMLKDAVKKNKITAEDFKEITGIDYNNSES